MGRSFRGNLATIECRGAGQLLFRRWNDEVLAFDQGSGDTHLLTGLSGQILEMVLDSPLSSSEIETALAATNEPGDGELSSEQVAQALAELRRLGLLG